MCVLFDSRSDGAQPHLVNIQFQKKVKLQVILLFMSNATETIVFLYVYIF